MGIPFLYKISSHNTTRSTKTRIAIVSHWDTRPYADRETNLAQQEMLPDGANDGGSGTAIMLEIARLTKDANLDLGIDFFFSMERKQGLQNMMIPTHRL